MKMLEVLHILLMLRKFWLHAFVVKMVVVLLLRKKCVFMSKEIYTLHHDRCYKF